MSLLVRFALTMKALVDVSVVKLTPVPAFKDLKCLGKKREQFLLTM